MDHAIFRTTFDISPSSSKITYALKLLFMGSCFTEHIGNKLLKLGFPVKVNPLGILFNPLSVADGIKMVQGSRNFREEDLIEFEGKWISLYHHGQFSGRDKHKTYQHMLLSLTQARDYITKESFLFITWGTAWVYKWKETGQVVANCHKIPNDRFEKELLEVSEIVLHYEKLLENLWGIYPGLQVVLTLSPVRHWKDGVEKNQVSKSTLRLAIYKLCELYDQVTYFPAYEWMMDDLRDYRFYAADMLHPHEVAIQYIWEKFDQMYFDQETREKYREIERLQRFLEHKPSDVADSKYLEKLKETKEKLSMLLE